MAKVRLRGDRVIWFIVAVFAMISIIAVFSVGSFLTKNNPDIMSKTSIYVEQFGSVALGFAALFLCYAINYKFYKRISPFIFIVAGVMLLMLFVPPLQDRRNGAVRGLKLMGHTLQVFEFVKIGLIMFISWGLEKYGRDIKTFKGFCIKLLVWVVAVCACIMVNSFSSAMLLALVSMMLFFFMDVKVTHLLLTVGIAIALVAGLFGLYHLALTASPKAAEFPIFNRLGTVESRVQHFIKPESDTTIDISKMTREQLEDMDREERQSESAKIAIKAGGLLGKGVGNGIARHSLSMAFSDFIYAAIVEETGLVGGIVIVLLYLIFLFRCISLSFRCPDTFSQSLVLGLAFLITTQAFLHILVNVRLIPITGHTLPLISHGGTAYLMLSAAFGMILSVSRAVNKLEEERRAEEAAAAAAAAEEEAGAVTTEEEPTEEIILEDK